MDSVMGFLSGSDDGNPCKRAERGRTLGGIHSPSSLLVGTLLTGDCLPAFLCLQAPSCSVPQHSGLGFLTPTPTDS